MPILPLTQAEFETTVATDRGLSEPVTIRFSAPMDAASVAAALTVEPDAAVDLDLGARRDDPHDRTDGTTGPPASSRP